MQFIRPNFFIIGAPKSGTTALSEYLNLHPNVFFCPIKEPEFFASDFANTIVSNEKTYLQLFQTADPSHDFQIGEGSTIYLFSEVAVLNILKFQPDAKIIVMVRNPVDLVISFHAQLLKSGNENIPSFLDAWNAEADRRKANRIPISCRSKQFLYYSEWGRIGTQLSRVMEIVPQGQLKVIVFDDFITDTRTIYKETLGFLGLPDDGRTQFPIFNERRTPKNQTLQNIFGFAMHLWLPLRVKLIRGKSFGIGKFINKYITTESPKEKLPPYINQMLTDYYEEEVKLLEKLLTRDFSNWRKERIK